jgi:hypothetical protein
MAECQVKRCRGGLAKSAWLSTTVPDFTNSCMFAYSTTLTQRPESGPANPVPHSHERRSEPCKSAANRVWLQLIWALAR